MSTLTADELADQLDAAAIRIRHEDPQAAGLCRQAALRHRLTTRSPQAPAIKVGVDVIAHGVTVVVRDGGTLIHCGIYPLPQTPKPAGAVPLSDNPQRLPANPYLSDKSAVPMPEPNVDGTVMLPIMRICYTAPVHYTKERLVAYGDAREAAAVGKLEQDILAVIDERDHRESVIDRILDAVLGSDRPKWSSVYGYEDAALAVEERESAASRVPECWRCFHCCEEFTDRDSAALHFGTHEHQEPACLIDVAKYREMEALQLRYANEDADVHRSMYRMESEHGLALLRAEESGYAKGLADAVKYPQDAAPLPQQPTADSRQMTTQVEGAARLDWMAHHGAALRRDNSSSVQGWYVHAPYHTGIHCVDDRHRFPTAREAIDAARSLTGNSPDA